MGALGERAGLVEQDRIDGAHPLQCEAILDEDPRAGRHRRRDRNHQRDRQAECVGAGDHQHGHGLDHRRIHVAQRAPDDERRNRSPGGDVEEQGREAVGEHLGPAAGRLRVGHHALDAGQRGVLPHRRDPDPDRRVGRHRAGHDPVALGLRHRARLAGDHRLIELGFAFDDLAVSGDSAASSHEHHVTDGEIRESYGLEGAIVADPLGVVGDQLGERGERAPRLADRLHLLPVPQQHDRDQSRELPPEVQVEPPEARGHRRRVRDGDRHRDEQHHPGLAVTDLTNPTLEERPATPEEHDRAEQRPDPLDAREVERVAEPVHDHVARHDERDGQDQRHPEAAPEHLRVMAGVLVMSSVHVMSSVLVVAGVFVVAGVLRDLWFMRRR